MSAGRKRRRKAAIRGASLEQWMTTRDRVKAEGQTPLGDAFDRHMRDAYQPVPRDPNEVKRLALVCVECGEEGHQRRECSQARCKHCGEYGHVKLDCHLIRCFLCGEYGHRQHECHLVRCDVCDDY